MNKVKRNTLIVLTGPTSVGKTELALRLAQTFSSPIINADSRQIYRQIPIGTAAPTPQQLALVKHYFVGTLGIDQYFSAAQYEAEVMSLLEKLFLETNTLLLSGGSMLYIDAVCNGIDDIPTVEEEVRRRLNERLRDEGLERLTAELRLLDPIYYNKVDLRNHKRIVHALEVCYQTGRPYSSFLTKEKKERPFNIIKIGLNRERNELFERINQRTFQMMDEGFLKEALDVYPLRHLNSLNTVGYKELFAFFDGLWSIDQAIEKIQRNTRVYAKKQLTWFKKDAQMRWFHPEEEEEILRYIATSLERQTF